MHHVGTANLRTAADATYITLEVLRNMCKDVVLDIGQACRVWDLSSATERRRNAQCQERSPPHVHETLTSN